MVLSDSLLQLQLSHFVSNVESHANVVGNSRKQLVDVPLKSVGKH